MPIKGLTWAVKERRQWWLSYWCTAGRVVSSHHPRHARQQTRYGLSRFYSVSYSPVSDLNDINHGAPAKCSHVQRLFFTHPVHARWCNSVWYVAGSALNRRSAAHLWQTALNWLNSAVTAAEVWSLVSRCPQAHRQKSILWGTPPYLPSLPQNGSPHLARGFGPPVGFLAEPRPQAILGAQETRVGGRDLCSSYAVQTRQWLPSG